MRRALVAILALTLFGVDARGAVACSCVPFTKPQLVENASVIFTGTVVETRGGVSFGFGPGGCYQRGGVDPVQVTFDVATVYKGDVAKRVTLVTASNSAACGYEFAASKQYTVFATRDDNGLATNLCRGNEPGAISPTDYGLGAGRPPRT